MIYKPEHVNDLDSGAIVSAQVLPGDLADSQEMAERVLSAVGLLQTVAPQAVIQELVADEGYFSAAEVGILQGCALRTVIVDPQRHRRSANAAKEVRTTLTRARRAVQSKSGKASLRRRGEYLERSFCHVLDHGGLRRATLRGCENLSKRHLAAALTHNLSLLLRKLFGVGTPKQFLAASMALFAFLQRVPSLICSILATVLGPIRKILSSHQTRPQNGRSPLSITAISSFSTGS